MLADLGNQSSTYHPPKLLFLHTTTKTHTQKRKRGGSCCVEAMSNRTTTHLKVEMMCEGCVGAVKRILGKTEGIEDFDVHLDSKKVVVSGTHDAASLIDKLNRAGKAATLWGTNA